MIVAAVAGAWLGAGVVVALAAAQDADRHGHRAAGGGDVLMLMTQLDARSRPAATRSACAARSSCVGIAGNFVLGALMTLGIGLYAPCMILVACSA